MNETTFNSFMEDKSGEKTANESKVTCDFPLLKPPPPYSVVVTPATPRTPTSQIRFIFMFILTFIIYVLFLSNFSLFDNENDEHQHPCQNGSGQSSFTPKSSVQYDSDIK